MTIKLVATDMDGTFLDGNGRFDMDRLKSLLVYYKEKGIYFAVASGRGFLSLEKLFADVRDDIFSSRKMAVWSNIKVKTCMKRLCLVTFICQLLKS